jgi:hypothetical protein
MLYLQKSFNVLQVVSNVSDIIRPIQNIIRLTALFIANLNRG